MQEQLITSGRVLKLPNFQNHTTSVDVFGHVCVHAPDNSKLNVKRQIDHTNIGGLTMKIFTGRATHIGSPSGRFTIKAIEETKLVISSGREVRVLSDRFMIAANNIKTNEQKEYNALCLAYLNGKTVDEIAKRPDAIFSVTTPQKRDAAISVMKKHGFYPCLKIMRDLVMS